MKSYRSIFIRLGKASAEEKRLKIRKKEVNDRVW
jgi:hypothetical protein